MVALCSGKGLIQQRVTPEINLKPTCAPWSGTEREYLNILPHGHVSGLCLGSDKDLNASFNQDAVKGLSTKWWKQWRAFMLRKPMWALRRVLHSLWETRGEERCVCAGPWSVTTLPRLLKIRVCCLASSQPGPAAILHRILLEPRAAARRPERHLLARVEPAASLLNVN